MFPNTVKAPPLVEFSWFYPACFLIVFGIAVFLVWWNLFRVGLTERREVFTKQKQLRRRAKELDVRQRVLSDIIADAGIERRKAENAAKAAENAADPSAARLAADEAAASAQRAADAARGASLTVQTLGRTGGRGKRKAKTVPTDADAHAAAAQAAAERAERAAARHA